MILLSLWSSIAHGFDLMMQPLYTAVSAAMVFFHWIVSFILPKDSGWAWALSIVLLTALIRTALIPLFVKTLRSSRNMQLIQPKIKALQEKYGSDREKVGQETMKLYKEEGVNPLASCLPMLIQIPIFIALYNVLYGASKGRPSGYYMRSRPDLVESLQNANVLGARLADAFWPMNNGFGPTQINSLILIIAMTALLFYTQLQMTRKNMPPEALTGPVAQQQKMMLYFFPPFYAFMGINIPIGVLIYWVFSNLWTVVQQEIMMRMAPTPNTPAYLDWEERMRKKGLDPRQIERDRAAKRKKPTVVAAADATTGIARQSVTRKGGKVTVQRQNNTVIAEDITSGLESADAPLISDSSSPTSKSKPVVTRQQPMRQARAVRKNK